MNQTYSKKLQQEALKLAEEIGTAAVARRLGMKSSTLYTWKTKFQKGNKEYGTGIPEKVQLNGKRKPNVFKKKTEG